MIFKIKLILVFLFLLTTKHANNYEWFIKNNIQAPVSSYHVVKVTMYTVDPAQTDDTPTETASGFIVDSINPKKHRIVAVSHDLKKKIKWGQKVKLVGAGKYSGIYVVKDLMNKRWKNRVDILINPRDKARVLKNVKLFIL